MGKYFKELVMKLLIHSAQESPIVPLENNNINVIHKDNLDIDQIPNYLYNEIECYDYLEYTEDETLDKLLAKITSKGILKLKGVDIYQASRNFADGNLTTVDMSKAIANGKRRCFSIHELSDIISSKNCSILFAGISGLNYMIEAQKND